MWKKRGEISTKYPPTSSNTNMNTIFSSLNGTLAGTIDDSKLVSNTQAVFYDFSKTFQNTELAAVFENTEEIQDLN